VEQRRGTADLHYPTAERIEDIPGLDVTEWADDNAHLYLWTTNTHLWYARELMELWGFDYKTCLTWAKTTKDGTRPFIGTGHYFRGSTEHVLFGVRGKLPLADTGRAFGTWFAAPIGPHSAKPDEFYTIVEQVSEGPYLDVFARDVRDGWSVWGNEAP
jgi:N6-adenosine-specific RNA methylase IME4